VSVRGFFFDDEFARAGFGCLDFPFRRDTHHCGRVPAPICTAYHAARGPR
jgi:hypothetical protein